jgi:hypothetical protein
MYFLKHYLSFLLIILAIIFSSNSAKKPKILIIGDSVSGGYTPYVANHFKDKAIVTHNAGNAGHTGMGLENIRKYSGDGDWDIIQFNWGLWDLCYRHPDSKLSGNRNKVRGKITFSVDEYQANLDSLVTIMKKISDIYEKSISIHKAYGIGNDDVHYTDKGNEELAKLIGDFLEKGIKKL